MSIINLDNIEHAISELYEQIERLGHPISTSGATAYIRDVVEPYIHMCHKNG
jgi:hypothetical protein